MNVKYINVVATTTKNNKIRDNYKCGYHNHIDVCVRI